MHGVGCEEVAKQTSLLLVSLQCSLFLLPQNWGSAGRGSPGPCQASAFTLVAEKPTKS